eukprot:2973209-Rhodomonas_salina.1
MASTVRSPWNLSCSLSLVSYCAGTEDTQTQKTHTQRRYTATDTETDTPRRTPRARLQSQMLEPALAAPLAREDMRSRASAFGGALGNEAHLAPCQSEHRCCASELRVRGWEARRGVRGAPCLSAEDHDGREGVDAVLRAQRFGVIGGTVHLCDSDLALFVLLLAAAQPLSALKTRTCSQTEGYLQCPGSLLPDRLQLLAPVAPRREEVDDQDLERSRELSATALQAASHAVVVRCQPQASRTVARVLRTQDAHLIVAARGLKVVLGQAQRLLLALVNLVDRMLLLLAILVRPELTTLCVEVDLAHACSEP